jgi:hypothetical protein
MIAQQVRNLIEPHAAGLEAAADAMENAGVGCANPGGHIHHLRAMAWSLRKSAEAGVVPDTYRMSGEKQMVEATPAVIQAALERREVKQVAHLLRKHSIVIDKVESIIDFDIKLRAAACPLQDRLLLKSTLLHAGLLV